MAKVTKQMWAEARAKREAGMSQTQVAKWLGVDRALVSRKEKAEGWSSGTNYEPLIRQRVTEKVVKKVTGCDFKALWDAIDLVAELRADVEIRHQKEWQEHKHLVHHAVTSGDFEAAKLAKITAETISIRQQGERKAWKLDAGTGDNKVEIVVKNDPNAY